VEDAAAVAALGGALGTEVLLDRLPPGPADEARLRTERYQRLESQRERANARFVLVAHNADDQAETVLLQLIRSTREASLAGMPSQRDALLRPLLAVPRAEIERYARARRLSFRQDPTNFEPSYLRNRIRKELLPLLERRYRPGLRTRLAALAAELAADQNQLWEPEASEARSGRENLRAPSVVKVPMAAIALDRRVWDGGPFPDGKREAVFDARILAQPVIRMLRPGDRILPFGARGRRKLQDVLVDAKVPRDLRDRLPLVATPEGQVVWVPGILRSAFAPVGPATEEVWVFKEMALSTCDGGAERSL
jgi:tRNA(Ile)-lysidine synthetase-like protein